MDDRQSLADPKNPTFLMRMKSGFAHIGNTQFLPGYCLLFADPPVRDLTDLDAVPRAQFMLDMGLLGDAIMEACTPLRINYGILGNSYPRLHAHLFPRFDWEPEERRRRNVWLYPEESWTDAEHKYSEEKHGSLKTRIIAALRARMDRAYAV